MYLIDYKKQTSLKRRKFKSLIWAFFVFLGIRSHDTSLSARQHARNSKTTYSLQFCHDLISGFNYICFTNIFNQCCKSWSENLDKIYEI